MKGKSLPQYVDLFFSGNLQILAAYCQFLIETLFTQNVLPDTYNAVFTKQPIFFRSKFELYWLEIRKKI